ncbi:CatB-related O-acetyltransferase [Pseudomonas viridiflava]|uniref:CatB-related O-acetyltransferase n=1 Tax=Pseudomonas viridiflava TaxID=33069 RepID=UPI0019679DDF|nr:CatB-related O-acetyltransferase [Pseudomonas viridiflava]
MVQQAYAKFSWRSSLRRLLAPILSERAIYQAARRNIRIEPGVICPDFKRIGPFTFLGRDVTVGPNVQSMGAFCSVGEGALIGPNIHPLDKLTTSAAFIGGAYRSQLKTQLNNRPVRVGNDVWIGAHAIILPGVTIGDGSIIGAGSVLTKDAPPYSIWVGNPARLLRYRLADATIARIQQMDIYAAPADVLFTWFEKSYGLDIDEALDLFPR